MRSQVVGLILFMSLTANAGLDCRALFKDATKVSYVHQMRGGRDLPNVLKSIENLFIPSKELVIEKRNLEEKKLALQNALKKKTWREWGFFKYFFGDIQILQEMKAAKTDLQATRSRYKNLSKKSESELKKGTELLMLVKNHLAKPISKVLRAGLVEKNASWLKSLKIEGLSVTDSRFSIIGENNEVEALFYLTAKKNRELVRFFVLMYIDFSTGDIKRAGLVNGTEKFTQREHAARQAAARGNALLKIGSVMKFNLTEVAENSPLQDSIKNLELKTSSETLQRIQMRSLKNPALAKQAQQVLNSAQSSKKAIDQSLLDSYLYYLAFGDSSLYFMPPTHWVLFHLTLPHEQQLNLGRVFVDLATTNSHYDNAKEEKDRFQSTIDSHGVPSDIPLELKEDPTVFDISNLTKHQQEIVSDRITGSIDGRTLMSLDEVTGISSMNFADEHSAQMFDDSFSPDTDSAVSVDSGDSYGGGDAGVSVDAGDGGCCGGGGD